MLDRIKDSFTESIQTKIVASEALPDAITQGAMMLVNCLLAGNKILACGNGGSALQAQHLASLLVHRFETERPSLPALALGAGSGMLTAVSNDDSFNEVFSKEVRALGQAGDVLLVISTSGNSRNLIKAMEAALSRDMTILALTGMDGGEMAGLLGPGDVEIRVPGYRPARTLEMHLLVLHALCDAIDSTLFSQED
ncbi:D-sedoheptulose-7-phosphate isomerase [Gallaecimonas xiamenensis]|uniref:Phosphoheptose isomerase n=1 Tax=Gallaecimonas xiamenensis 3-C-1 TaxID=745411 RepID=K2JLQ4_9GAMM|nr:SIS domain-containing protein [Gallaecimonas xiamenensis]EKE71464.1 phosphoheptose isomerase [Gallaecimonas xiamenensis 3-C-1]